MKKWIIVLTLFAAVQAGAALTPWQQAKQPVKGAPQSVGGFSNGCIIGAQPLALENDGYQVMRSKQRRYFGHPELIAFIHRLTDSVAQNNLGTLLIGDMGMPVGGRFSSGHASHQTGLDVDIWLQLPQNRWSQKQLESPKAIDLVDSDGKRVVDSRWQPEIGRLIQLAAEDKQVTRIFVHPAIKQQLCLDAGSDRRWLRKVRPWFGHRAHMHVRIACPVGSKECIDQPLPPVGDGCGEELTSWLTEKTLPSAKPNNQPPPKPPKTCQALLDNNFKLANGKG
jgi:penicillin-insensitive murein endopeptidase